MAFLEGINKVVNKAVDAGMSPAVAALILHHSGGEGYDLDLLKTDLQNTDVSRMLRVVGDLILHKDDLDKGAVNGQLGMMLDHYEDHSGELRSAIGPLVTSLMLRLVSQAQLSTLLIGNVPAAE